MPLMVTTNKAIASASVVLILDIPAEKEDIVFHSRDLFRLRFSRSERFMERWSLMVTRLVLQYLREEECYNIRWAH